jgi:hypothetical protein
MKKTIEMTWLVKVALIPALFVNHVGVRAMQ